MQAHKTVFVASLAILVLVASVGLGKPAPATTLPPTATDMPSGPGASAVYRLIARSTDCGELRQEFSIASTSYAQAHSEWFLRRMHAASARQRAIGCDRKQRLPERQ